MTPGKKYKFRVKAVNKEGESDPLESTEPVEAKNPYREPDPPRKLEVPRQPIIICLLEETHLRSLWRKLEKAILTGFEPTAFTLAGQVSNNCAAYDWF